MGKVTQNKRTIQSKNPVHKSLSGTGLPDLSVVEDEKGLHTLTMIGKTAGINAMNENKALKLPFTYVKNGWIVKEFADGRVEKIAEIGPAPVGNVKLTKGTLLHATFC